MRSSASCWVCCEAKVMESWNKPSQAVLFAPPARLRSQFQSFCSVGGRGLGGRMPSGRTSVTIIRLILESLSLRETLAASSLMRL
jgi:hypothetical protein